MAPSHSKPEQVQTTINQMIFLLDTIDNKVLLAYHDYVASKVRDHSYSGVHDEQYAILAHIIALKIVLQNGRRQQRG